MSEQQHEKVPDPPPPNKHDIERWLQKTQPSVLAGMSATQKDKLLKAATLAAVYVKQTQIESFSGPFPKPDHLQQYKDIDPDLPRQIADMATREQTHAHNRDNTIISEEFNLKRRGQLFAFIITIFISGGGLAAILMGHEVSGTVFGGLGLAGLVGLFLKTVLSDRAE
jgi:uncharacterized membrane protein